VSELVVTRETRSRASRSVVAGVADHSVAVRHRHRIRRLEPHVSISISIIIIVIIIIINILTWSK